jgi:predicted mannosyl-3-phosphoglycerate phosphatase (HAD superfamily)
MARATGARHHKYNGGTRLVEYQTTISGLVEPVTSELLATWGVPGLIAGFAIAAAVGAVIFIVKMYGGLTSAQVAQLEQQMKRIESLATQLAEMTKERNQLMESYLAVKYPNSGREDIAEQIGMDPVAEEET